MFKINDYITKENYTAGAIWCNQNNAMIAVLKEGGRVRYQIQAVSVAPEPSYAEKRAAEYPPMADYLDAQVKLNSGIPELMAEGQAQLDAYIAACLAVKEKYPKLVKEGSEPTNENETVESPHAESAGA